MSMIVTEVLLASANFNGESSLPSVYEVSNVQGVTDSILDEDDGLFLGYGSLSSPFPYRMQDLYDRATEEKPYLAVILENQYLRAMFLPALGGRLWSLYDKVRGRDLLYANPVVRPCNLAVRNAWVAGGIEFNCGVVGHTPFTCAQIFACETHLEDGTPVLRMYEYERIRNCVYQMDFFLPETSRVLFGRMRIVNPGEETVPMYWWTNMAVREDPEARDVMDATSAYTNLQKTVLKKSVPFADGIDITYPAQSPVAIDYFWKVPDESRKFTALLGKNGYGFVQTSSARLKGRKLFVWGQGKGGARWQEFLTDPDTGETGRYVEIQAGLARTQYECIPMPPKTAWEWIEAYGALSADPQKIHGDWTDCRREAERCLDCLIGADALETLLVKTKPMATRPADRMLVSGSGWGALENARRIAMGKPPVCPHLDFGDPKEEQTPWLSLLQTGKMAPADALLPPTSWMLQKEWTQLILEAPDCHEKHLHLAAIALAENRLRDGREAIACALSYRVTPTALFILAQTEWLSGNQTSAAQTALRAHSMLPGDISLARQALGMAMRAGCNTELLAAYQKAPASIREDGRISMYAAFALLHTGQTDEAEALLLRGNGLLVMDIRENEISLTELYLEIAEARATEDGKPFDPQKTEVPKKFDFRMN